MQLSSHGVAYSRNRVPVRPESSERLSAFQSSFTAGKASFDRMLDEQRYRISSRQVSGAGASLDRSTAVDVRGGGTAELATKRRFHHPCDQQPQSQARLNKQLNRPDPRSASHQARTVDGWGVAERGFS